MIDNILNGFSYFLYTRKMSDKPILQFEFCKRSRKQHIFEVYYMYIDQFSVTRKLHQRAKFSTTNICFLPYAQHDMKYFSTNTISQIFPKCSIRHTSISTNALAIRYTRFFPKCSIQYTCIGFSKSSIRCTRFPKMLNAVFLKSSIQFITIHKHCVFNTNKVCPSVNAIYKGHS